MYVKLVWLIPRGAKGHPINSPTDTWTNTQEIVDNTQVLLNVTNWIQVNCQRKSGATFSVGLSTLPAMQTSINSRDHAALK